MTVASETPHLTVRTVPLRDHHALLGHLPENAPLAWLHNGDGLVGWGEAARLVLPTEDEPDGQRFDTAARWMSELAANADVEDSVGLPGTGPVAFGGFTFDPRSSGSTLIVPRVVVGHRAGRVWLTTIVDRPGAHPDALLSPVTSARYIGPLNWSDGTLSAEEWGDAVATAVQRIKAAELNKVVLARDLHAEADNTIDVRTLLFRLARAYPNCYTFCVDGLVGATPELLLRRAGGDVTSLVLAGTRPRGTTPDEDERIASELMASAKETEEHRYAAESLRAALTPLASTIRLPDQPELLRLANVQHLASPASAALRDGVSTFDVIAAMHPTAAVGGTPARAAMDLIRELEGMDRGRYAGPVGWIDARGDGEWGIALRCAHLDGSRARLFAGCGIVAGSDPEAELAEADSKFRVMRSALAD
ncbi:menaquinone-specific isochorismate synthase [Lipingzhangella halophila]|uniref:isochorismate synthase n=1 Tax=Lipingzhangella halophila TaxID=1783352 RepID=A0A7W7RHF6_9ACTN|nr:isochorismate synthase [Lipingzhangella halophila]MBB4932049.1 menaquinone-specific isochorismate synthase [Lipingzhangella halophila]